MNARILIDGILRHTTVLVAQLATSGGLRAPLVGVANQVFLELAEELDRQGVSRKVSADMFGLALRGYQRRLQRLTESRTDRGRTLWESVLAFLGDGRLRTRQDVLSRFGGDDETIVRGVLHDLVESGLVFTTGTGPDALHRIATQAELGEGANLLDGRGVDELVWVTVFREGPLDRSSLERLTHLSGSVLDQSLQRLGEVGRVRVEGDGGAAKYRSGEFVIPLANEHGWAAAVLDHFHAVVTTIAAKLREPEPRNDTGGSTYTFVVWPGHPYEDEVRGELRRYRERQTELRARVDAYNRDHGIPNIHDRVLSYAGQTVLEGELREDGT
ncbi:MAG TPA: hypothetical protein VHE30_02810 [Polyangiaceae bacterium]|nr:hypothetical protein [Polyangiaceae bacterium]